MITKRTRSLGVLVNNVRSFTASSMLGGVEETARRNGYEIMLTLHRDDAATALAALRELTARRIDAVIAVFAKADEHPEVMAALPDLNLPCAIAFYQAAARFPLDNIIADQEQGAFLAVTHLLQQGRRRIAFAGGPTKRNATCERLRGFVSAHHALGLTPDPCLIVFDEYHVSAGIAMAEQLLPARPDAVFAADDNIAAGVLRACRTAGVRVPTDVAVMGYNDGPLCQAVDPPLSSVRMPLGDIGRQCVERMIERLEHPDTWRAETKALPCQLILRDSA